MKVNQLNYRSLYINPKHPYINQDGTIEGVSNLTVSKAS